MISQSWNMKKVGPEKIKEVVVAETRDDST